MIKVLDKAFGILEAVVVASPAPIALAPLAEKLGINKATCSRIIRELVDAGYLEQVSRQAGYVAGPRALTLGMRVSYAGKLLESADGLVRHCAETIGQSVLLAIMHQGLRYILIHYNYNPNMKIDLTQLAFNDTYGTATGLVLLAYSSEKEVAAARALREQSQSRLYSNACKGMAEDKLFRQIRQDGKFVYDGPEHSFALIACPVFKNGQLAAALGMSAPHADFVDEARRQAMLTAVKTAADKITANLSDSRSVG